MRTQYVTRDEEWCNERNMDVNIKWRSTKAIGIADELHKVLVVMYCVYVGTGQYAVIM